jgi:ankyrin repeat protein
MSDDEEPIFNAIDMGNLAVVRSILESDPNQVKATDAEGNTPLTSASHTGNVRIIKLILQQPGVDIDETDVGGNTPLCIASMYGDVPLVNLLLERGSSINKANLNKDTPMSIASKVM